MLKRVRNKNCLPYLKTEGTITKAFECPKPKSGGTWYAELTPFERCHIHQTLASVRRSYKFRPHDDTIPKDNLDILLRSTHNQTKDIFPDKVDVCLQPETVGIDTHMRVRNTKDVPPGPETKGMDMGFGTVIKGVPVALYNSNHPLIMGGVMKREHPCHVKLLVSSYHNPITIHGYTRQDDYGTFYRY